MSKMVENFDIMNKSTKFSSNQRLTFNLTENDTIFTDTILQFHDKQYHAYSILLCRYSKWFNDKFKENHFKIDDKKYVIELPEDPQGMMSYILKYLHNNSVSISIKNAPVLLKITSFYEITHLQFLIRNFIYESIKSNNTWEIIQFYASQFVQYDLIDDSLQLVPYLEPYFIKAIEKAGKPSNITTNSICKCCKNGLVFAFLLKLIQEQIKLEDFQKIQLIEEFYENTVVKEGRLLSNQEKEALSSNEIINWTNDKSYQFLVNYKCEWLPSKLAKTLYSKLFMSKKSIISDLIKDTQKDSQIVSRWYVFSWLTSIFNADKAGEEIEFTKFLTTLGGLIQPINPELYGIINQQGNGLDPRLIMDCMDHFNVFFDNDDAFIIQTKFHGIKNPAVLIDIGKSNAFAATRIMVHMDIKLRRGSEIKTFQTISNRIQIHAFLGEKYVFSSTVPVDQNERGVFIDFPYTFNKIIISPTEDCYVFKIRFVEFLGRFLISPPR